MRYAECVDQPRFLADSVEHLVELARNAEPPVKLGDIAEIALPRRRVRVQVAEVNEESEVVWLQVAPS